MSYALLGAVVGALALTPLSLTRYGLALGLLFGIQAHLARAAAPDPSGWTQGHASSGIYRAGAALLALVQIVLMLLLAVGGVVLVGRG